MVDPQELILDISQSTTISAATGDAWHALIRRLTSASTTPDNRPLPMVLEQWPGGRWFRDLGQGQGHLWGFVQVIRPPVLIEIHGPMFMSYAVAGHVQFRLSQVAGGTQLDLRHQVIGQVASEHRDGVVHGWAHFLRGVQEQAGSTDTGIHE